MTDKEVATKIPTELAIPDEDLGLGFEDMEGQDFAAPFLVIVQTTSPYVNPAHQMYVPEAKPATILNTMNNNTYKSVNVVPCKYAFRNVEWKPRNTGGGFVASYTREDTPTDLVINPMTNRQMRPNGNEIMATAYYLCLLVEENYEKVILPFTSTQLKKARKWNTLMASLKNKEGKNLPMFSRYYELSIIGEQNSKGSWFGWKIDIDDPVEQEVYAVAKQASQIGNFLPDSLIKAHQSADAPADTTAF